MSDDKPRPDDETQPVRPEGGGAAPRAAPTPTRRARAGGDRGARRRPGGPPRLPRAARRPAPIGRRPRLRAGRAHRLRAGGIIVGGLGFAAVHAITDDGARDRGGWVQQRDADDRGSGGRGGMHGGPRGVPGQLPPTTPPEDEDGSDVSGIR